jgi:hypothetical protein
MGQIPEIGAAFSLFPFGIPLTAQLEVGRKRRGSKGKRLWLKNRK